MSEYTCTKIILSEIVQFCIFPQDENNSLFKCISSHYKANIVGATITMSLENITIKLSKAFKMQFPINFAYRCMD